MDNFNWMLTELLIEQRRDALERAHLPLDSAERPPSGGAKRAFASALVRLGLRLDPAAGEALGALPHLQARR